MKEDKIYNKKRADRNKKLKECYPNITSKPLRLLAEIICILKLQKLVSFIQLFFPIIPYILIFISTVIVLIFLSKIIPIKFYSFNSSIEKEKEEILKITLTTPSQKKWLENINEFKIEIKNKTCTTFKLNKNDIDIKRGFHNIKFKSNDYTLSYKDLQNEMALLNGLDKTLNEMCKIYSVNDLWFFAKGYADKSDNPKGKYPLKKDYFYNKIDYYKLNKIENVYLIDNKINIKTLYLQNNQFTNNDLIYLRSNFVGEEIFKKFLKFSYIDVKNKQFGILEGDVLDEKDKEYRKTDIYVTFCKDN